MRNNSTWAPLAPSPTTWPREAWHPGLTLLAFVAVVVILFLVQGTYVYYAVAFAHETPRQLTTLPPTQLLLLQFATFTPIAAFLLLILPRLAKRSLGDLGFRAPTRRDVLVGVAGAVVMAIVVDGSGALLAALTHRHDTEQAVVLLKSLKTQTERFMFVFLACAFAPFCEELAFRVFIFNALTRYAPVAGAAIASGAVFGLLHVSSFPGEVLTVGIPLMLGGIVLAYVYQTTRSFWSNFTTHALFNTISVVSFFAFHAT